MESHKEIISRLKFICKLQKNEKVNVKLLSVQSDGVITKFLRTVLQDNRSKTLSFIQDTVNKSFELITCYDRSPRSSELIMCRNIIEDLKKCKTGLVNIKETYVDDIKFCCDIDTLLQLIDAKLVEYDGKYEKSDDGVTLNNNNNNISPLMLPKSHQSSTSLTRSINIHPHSNSTVET